jgi:hypothetical protein
MGDWELDRLREQSPGPGKRLLDEFAVYVASWWVAKKRPDVEALKKLGFAFAGLAPLLFVIVFLAAHRSSELWGGADAMMIFAAIGAIERFHAVLDAWKELVRKSKLAGEETVERLARARSGEPELIAVPPAQARVAAAVTDPPAQARVAAAVTDPPAQARVAAAVTDPSALEAAAREAAMYAAAEQEAVEEEVPGGKVIRKR